MEPGSQSGEYNQERAQLPRNMIENSMFEEEPDIVDLAKEPRLHPLEPDEVEYEPHSSRLLVRGLGEHDLEDDEEDYESSARLLGMSFMNRSSNHRNNMSGVYNREASWGPCSFSSARTILVGAFVMVIILSIAMVVYFLPKCTFTKEGCHKKNTTLTPIYPLATNGQVFPWPKMRLSNAVVPVHYDLTLHPNLTTMKFTGSVQITLRVKEDVNNITLHSYGLNISKATIVPEASNQAKDVQILEYRPHQQIAITVNPALLNGKTYTLNLEYAANLSDGFSGFYKSSYQSKNKTRILAATQFEPSSARKAFPCFDEPAFKATFTIKIIREAEHISLSNMQKNDTISLGNGLFQDSFAESLTMSTYLVAFIVAELKNVSEVTENGILVSVYAVPDKMDQMHYALEASMKLLKFYEDFFNISYPLKKLDLVAIPDFEAGAMENWGLITFREITLLYKEDSASVLDKQIVSMVIAHELAHQWFGNLVTMEWWNDLWLNEGFATFMEFFSLEKVFPELQVADRFLHTRFKAMEKDSMNSSHPLSTPVKTAEQIEEMFDSISYEKGASILLMLKDFLSETVFQQGIKRYLNEHKYRNTKNEDFWNSIAKVKNVDFNVKEMMKTWTLQTGFPVVTVKLDTTANKIHLSQEHFLRISISQDPSSSPNSSYLWHIPLTYMTSSCSNYGQPQCIKTWFLKSKTDVIDLKEPNVTWVKFNVNMSGYYIIHYEGDISMELSGLLQNNHLALSDQDRAGLINNAFVLASAGKVSMQQALSMTKYMKNESSNAPIAEALFQLHNIYWLVQKRGMLQLTDRMEKYIFDIFGDLIDHQTWSNDGSLSERQLRAILLTVACDYNYGNCAQNASELFNMWENTKNLSVLPSDLTRTIYTVGARADKGWTFIRQMYNTSQVEAEKRKMLQALAQSSNPQQLIGLMQESLQHETIRAQELPSILATASKTLVGYLFAWDFVKENWDNIVKKFQLGSFTIETIIAETTSHFSTKTRLFEVQTFFDSLKDEGSQLRAVQEALEIIRLNIQWMDKNLKSLEEWL
ncbi:leucyl-cystinyl aminopeptidase-like isoform X1 [Chiloscyllium plagiosum]|uniref:leucyl-cystinyl aminopeptidase-like isoform X1 n=1 Tax=Chiloscyllium plagiosum TaxID=36176 RepID=UPI001CB7D0F0|nr:leucyl-cystinyl aminopeptidase-like isoform X1 [Chiloscyllium plagiosum]